MNNQKTNEITTGVIWKQILIFFFPILLGAFFQTLYNTVDASVVGKFAGEEALASVGGSSGQILNFVFSFFMGLATGATVIIAQYFGAGDVKSLDDALHTAYTAALIGGLVLSVAGVIFCRPFLELLDTPESLMASSAVYVRVLMAGLVFTLIYNIGSGILRAIGDSKRPLYILMACCGMNIVLDLFFVVTLHLGVLGAAIATDISQAASAAVVTWILMKKTDGMKLAFAKLHIRTATLWKILKIGLPTAIAGSMFSVSNMIVQTAINHMGVPTMAAWTAYGRIDALWWMINQAFSVSVTTFVGQNYGAMLPDRVRKAVREVLAMEISSGIAMGALFILEAPVLLGVFTSNDEVISLGIQISLYMAPFYWTFAISEILSATLRAENYVMVSTVANLLGVFVFRIIWIKWIVPDGTLQQVISCYPISWCLISAFVAGYYLYRQPKITRSMRAAAEKKMAA